MTATPAADALCFFCVWEVICNYPILAMCLLKQTCICRSWSKWHTAVCVWYCTVNTLRFCRVWPKPFLRSLDVIFIHQFELDIHLEVRSRLSA